MAQQSRLRQLQKFADAQCLPLGLVFSMAFGAFVPAIGVAFSTGDVLAIICVVVIFVVSGLKLKTAEAKEAIAAWQTTLAGIISILLLTCMLGCLITLPIPFAVSEFKLGMIIFFCMPCTINSGAVMAKQAGGNFAMALLLTVSSNVIGIFTSPVLLYLFANVDGVEFPVFVGSLLWKLGLTVFVPLLVGKALRELPVRDYAIRRAVDRYNKKITLCANGLLIMVPWMKFSNTVASGALANASFVALLIVLAWTSLVHLLFLGVNLAIGRVLNLSEPILKALVMVGSSKTLPMALTVLTFLGDFGGDAGLVALPCIIGHLGQIVFDGFLASWWAQRSASETELLPGPDADQGSAPQEAPNVPPMPAGEEPAEDLANTHFGKEVGGAELGQSCGDRSGKAT